MQRIIIAITALTIRSLAYCWIRNHEVARRIMIQSLSLNDI